MYTTAPAHLLRRRAEFPPSICRTVFRLCFQKSDTYFFTFLLYLIDYLISVWKLHSRITKQNHKSIMRQCSLNNVQRDHAVFPARKSYIKNVNLFFVILICVVSLFNSFLHQPLQNTPVLLDHRRNINKSEWHSIRLRIFKDFYFRRSIAGASFCLRNFTAPIKIVIGLSPHIGIRIVLGIVPVFIKSQYIQFFIVNRTWFLAEGQR